MKLYKRLRPRTKDNQAAKCTGIACQLTTMFAAAAAVAMNGRGSGVVEEDVGKVVGFFPWVSLLTSLINHCYSEGA